MTDTIVIPVQLLTGHLTFVAGATAYPPLPIDPFENRSIQLRTQARSEPRPAPSQPSQPSQPSSPNGPVYPSLPVDPDTRDG